MRVLVADDNGLERAVLSGLLERAGYDVEAAGDGRAALERVLSGGPRLVISDWHMPGLSGVELCRAVRREELPGYVYVILVTGDDSPGQRVEGLTAGADDFVGKPYDPGELLARVRSGERVLSLETRDVTIFALAKLAESRDHETGGHLERVRSYARVLAQDLAGTARYHGVLDGEQIRLVYQTSPLHDIGKVGVPDSVLLKPGRLSPDEFEVMKTHTDLGVKTLSAAQRQFPGVRFLEMARDIAGGHHERYDGGGYPRGLSGEAIPLAARIVALADVYDALTSKRVYKGAFSHGLARGMIVAEAGRHFDPMVVESFVRNEGRFVEVRRRYGEAAA